MDDRESAWRELDKDVDLYKFYLDLLLKAGAFVLGITGALTSYYFAHEKDVLIVYSLLLPVVVNGGFRSFASSVSGLRSRCDANTLRSAQERE